MTNRNSHTRAPNSGIIGQRYKITVLTMFKEIKDKIQNLGRELMRQ